MKTTKLPQRVIEFALCASMLFFLSGCVAWTNVSGIKPIYPKAGALVSEVDSLQPELKWKGVDGSKKYDLAIWNSIQVEGFPQRRKIIYEKTALSGTSHKIETILDPGQFYFWSVRETGSEKWSTVKMSVVSGIPTMKGTGVGSDMFMFYTPTMEKMEKKQGK